MFSVMVSGWHVRRIMASSSMAVVAAAVLEGGRREGWFMQLTHTFLKFIIS
jgi:hypothetical protein